MDETRNHYVNRFSAACVISLSSKLWPDQPAVAEAMAKEASQIIQISFERKCTFFSGKSAKGVLSGLFYFLGIMHSNFKTQREIARGLNTTDATVRMSYRDWLMCFPDLFPAGWLSESHRTAFATVLRTCC
jgi:hypothetical protein